MMQWRDVDGPDRGHAISLEATNQMTAYESPTSRNNYQLWPRVKQYSRPDTHALRPRAPPRGEPLFRSFIPASLSDPGVAILPQNSEYCTLA